MSRFSSLSFFLFMVSVLSCAPPAQAPRVAHDLPRAFAQAFRVDATGDANDAVTAYLDVVAQGAQADGDPWQIPALDAALDALVVRVMPSLGDAQNDAALAWRTRAGAGLEGELARAFDRAEGPFARGAIARALLAIAQRRGDERSAASWRARTGCATEASVAGPLTWAVVTGVEDASNDAVFRATRDPVRVSGRGCAIPLSAASARPGVRQVAIDLRVDRAQTIGLALRAHGEAVLRANGTVVAKRAFELGDGDAARLVRLDVTRGTLRVVARVGTAKEDDSVEIDAWAEDGSPLRATAAEAEAPSDASRVMSTRPIDPAPESSDETLLASSAALALGSPRDAERMLWGRATRADAAPELALAYARAVETARDLSPAVRAERARSAYQRVLDAWPSSWEAAIAHAVLAGVRRGRSEGGIDTLRDLESSRAKDAAHAALLDAFDALASGRERLFDRAAAALERARPTLSGSAFFSDAEAAAAPRTGADLASRECSTARPRDTLSCFDLLRAAGNHDAAMREIDRLRALLGAPARFAPLDLRESLATHDQARTRAALSALLPGEATSNVLALGKLDASRVLALAPDLRDSPLAVAPLLRAGGDDPTHEFDGIAEKIAVGDRASPILPSAATAILAHVERYDLRPSGLLRWVLFDVRRVNGTTDVEENAQAEAPEIWGRPAMRALRRRILKRDGRIVEPDRTPRASQAHADLSQLEQGDVVEAIYEGFALPGDRGDIGIDTADLLPERTAVHDATIEMRVPSGVRGSLWTHPILGKPIERPDGEARVMSWHLVDRPVRRVEDGVPKMDRKVGVSFSAARWSEVARALRETIATLDEHGPEMAAWAREAAGPAADNPSRATVEAIVAAAGRAIKEADASQLSDYGGFVAPVQTVTARTFLSSHDGSRSWIIVRSLRELGVPCDVVVAESDPFSADPQFPPHFGRFVHPLVVAHVAGDDIWIDADVAGPPLPAGRVSPELRGRMALRADGSISALPASLWAAGSDDRDEIDVRLALDDKGDARGTFAVVLRGRDAQELAEALVRTVGAERQRALRDVILAWLPWANVDEVQLSSSEGSWQVSLRAEVSVSGYAQQEGSKNWLLPGLDALHGSSPRAHVSSLASTFAARGGRESALALGSAVQYHVHRRIELPKGAIVARMPGPLDVKGRLVEASRKIAVSSGAIEDDFVLGVATGTIAAADYAGFVATAHATDDGFLASTRIAVP